MGAVINPMGVKSGHSPNGPSCAERSVTRSNKMIKIDLKGFIGQN